MLWSYWLQRARWGDQQATALMLESLASGLLQDNLPVDQRAFLAGALQEIARAPVSKRVAVCKESLLFTRRPGAKPRYRVEEERQARARAVWDVAGFAEGAALERALEKVAIELGIGREGNRAPDLRALKLAYLDYRDALREESLNQPEPDPEPGAHTG